MFEDENRDHLWLRTENHSISYMFCQDKSTKIVTFSYPKLLLFSVLTFIKWRLTPSYAAKDTIFWQKNPKAIVIVIIVRMIIFKSIHMILIDTEEGHLLIENFVNVLFVTSLSVSLHNLLDFYDLFCLCCIVMSRRSVTH
jgi:hypothetical protein